MAIPFGGFNKASKLLTFELPELNTANEELEPLPTLQADISSRPSFNRTPIGWVCSDEASHIHTDLEVAFDGETDDLWRPTPTQAYNPRQTHNETQHTLFSHNWCGDTYLMHFHMYPDLRILKMLTFMLQADENHLNIQSNLSNINKASIVTKKFDGEE